MTAKPEPHLAAKPQFSIRLLLVATTAVAAAVGVFVAEPSLVSLTAFMGLSIFYASFSFLLYTLSIGRFKMFWFGTAGPMVIAAVASVVFLAVGFWELPDDESPFAECDEVMYSIRAMRLTFPIIGASPPSTGFFASSFTGSFGLRKDRLIQVPAPPGRSFSLSPQCRTS